MRTAALLAVTTAATSVAAQDGQTGCKCLTELPAALKTATWQVDKGGVATLKAATAGSEYFYGTEYGVGCQKHDTDKPPFCADSSALNTFPQVGTPFTYSGTGKNNLSSKSGQRMLFKIYFIVCMIIMH